MFFKEIIIAQQFAEKLFIFHFHAQLQLDAVSAVLTNRVSIRVSLLVVPVLRVLCEEKKKYFSESNSDNF
jgi:hypothetical protein